MNCKYLKTTIAGASLLIATGPALADTSSVPQRHQPYMKRIVGLVTSGLALALTESSNPLATDPAPISAKASQARASLSAATQQLFDRCPWYLCGN